ncbi:sensor histidine kinase [Alkalihalobacillus trypoxylicola]|uniref:histidine kinase n=1 Tax=Alkalihalobacillus trypoxylicola TaxID=519424 RepID=A0A162DEV7_9BACI|nr:sensor histidine kinase [Alkalihalobacillus trypoxylicola]KYG29417.1 hypothetical protein AZF04_07790 [Alkalihalobacillus trypoxylicola]
MNLFFKEYKTLFLAQFIQFVIILSILWLAGYRNLTIIFYAIFLCLVVFVLFCFYYYQTRKVYYKRLEKPFQTLDESYSKTNANPIAQMFDKRIVEQYRYYKEEMNELKAQQDHHRKFMDQWVHQMKTPLSVIELTAETVDEPQSSDLRAESDRLKEGLHTILYMSRLRTIEQDFHVKEIELYQLVQEVTKAQKRFFIRNQVYPKMVMEQQGIHIKSDEKWLYFIMSQLINNGVKYSTGKSSTIEISVYQKKKEVILEIRDYGVGIPTKDFRRLFEPFFTGENGRKNRESTGMGLYLAKEALDFLEHNIEFDSEVGVGTSFRIIFSETQNLTRL